MNLEEFGKAQAEYVLKAVNLYPELVESLKNVLDALRLYTEGEQCDHDAGICWCGVKQDMDEARKVLAKIEV
jgi:hypothetical protein